MRDELDRPDRRLPAAAAAPDGRAAADGRRRLDRRRQVDARQLASSARTVSAAGVLRPTTRAPVLVCNPGDLALVRGQPHPPGPRPHDGRRARRPAALRAGADRRAPAGARPPRRARHRLRRRGQPRPRRAAARRRRLVAVRDHRRALRRRGAVGHAARGARPRHRRLARPQPRPRRRPRRGAGHLREMLDERGLGDDAAAGGARRPRWRTAGCRRRRSRRCAGWLDALPPDASARGELVRRTLAGALDSIPPRVGDRASRARRAGWPRPALREAAEHAYGRALDEVDETVRSGSLLRGEVLARWHEVVGTGDFMRALEAASAGCATACARSCPARRRASRELRAAVGTGRRRGGRRRRRPRRGAGGGGLARAPRRARAARGRGAHGRRVDASCPARTEAAVRAWQGHVFELVRDGGRGQAHDRAARVAGGQRRGAHGDDRRVRPHRRADRRGGRGRRRHLGGRPARARGDLRRPGRPLARRTGARRSARPRARAARRRGGALRPAARRRRAGAGRRSSALASAAGRRARARPR